MRGPNDLGAAVVAEADDPKIRTVIDLGCGYGHYLHVMPPRLYRIAVDAHPVYLTAVDAHTKLAAEVVEWSKAHTLPVCQRWEAGAIVMLLDFIEHLDKDEGRALLERIQRHNGTQKIVVFTPLGFHPQETDETHTGAEHWQRHRSGWDVDDLEDLGFAVEVWDFDYGKPGMNKALWAVWRP